MDSALIVTRLGEQIRRSRLGRGLTQSRLAALAGVTRQKLIDVEKGKPSVGMNAYAQVLAALDCEVSVIPAAMPTLDDVGSLFE